MTQVIKVRWQQRRGTAADLASKNEVPLDGERIFETDTNKFKTGDGVTHYNDLAYEVTGSGSDGGVRNPEGDSYIPTIDDNGYTVISGSSTPFTLILPSDDDVALPIGAKVAYTQGGTGQLSVVGDSSVTVHAPNGNTTGAQWDGGVAEKIAADEWQLWNGPSLGDMATIDDAPSDGKVYGRKNGAWSEASGDGGGAGTVTSVALTLPAEFAVSGSPITSSGTLAGTWADVAAGKVLAGPSSGADAAPSFRALTADDLPASGVSADTYGDATHVPQVTVDAAGRVTDVSEVTISGGSGGGITGVNEQTGTTYTLVADDATKVVRCTNSSAIALTIPKHADVALPLYCVIPILQGGAGAVTITGDGFTPASPNGAATTAQDDFRTLFQRDTDDWVIG